MHKYILLLLLLYFPFHHSGAQVYYRIKADFILKARAPSGQQQLTIGKVFFDKNIKQIVYDITFPEKEIWVQKDTVLYKIINSKIAGRQTIPSMIDFSIYNLILNGNLSDYGLRKTSFRIKNVQKADNNVISTWEPPKELKKIFGDVLISNVNQQLDGIIFKNHEGQVISRQFFRNYLRVKGISFPQEIVKEVYSNGEKGLELTNYSNVLINDLSGDKYDFKIPAD